MHMYYGDRMYESSLVADARDELPYKLKHRIRTYSADSLHGLGIRIQRVHLKAFEWPSLSRTPYFKFKPDVTVVGDLALPSTNHLLYSRFPLPFHTMGKFINFVEGVLSSLVHRDSRRNLRNAEKNKDLESLLKNLRQRANSLGRCLSGVELAILVWKSEPTPIDAKLREEWFSITKGFPNVLYETLKLTGSAIARMEDVNDVVAFLSSPNQNPSKIEEKQEEIGVLQKEIFVEIKRTETLLQNWEDLSVQLSEYRQKSSASKCGMTDRTKRSVDDVISNVGLLLKKDPLDRKLVDILKTTSFPGTMHSTTRLLSTDDCLQLHKLLEGDTGRTLDPNSEEGITVRTQLESLLNVWKILMADFNAILDATSRDIAGCTRREHYQGKINIVLDVYATYSLCLKEFSRQRAHK